MRTKPLARILNDEPDLAGYGAALAAQAGLA